MDVKQTAPVQLVIESATTPDYEKLLAERANLKIAQKECDRIAADNKTYSQTERDSADHCSSIMRQRLERIKFTINSSYIVPTKVKE